MALNMEGLNPVRVWMFVSFSVCCGGSSLCDTLITHSEESYQVCESNCAQYRNLNNDTA